MQFAFFAAPAVILVTGTSLLLLTLRDWRFSLAVLGLQYVGVFFLVGLSWPLEMAVVKLVTGWIAAAVLGMELISGNQRGFGEGPVAVSRQLFRLFLAVMVGLVIFSLVPETADWMLRAAYEQILGGLLLLGMGVLQLGLSGRPFRVILGILTALSGFEILLSTLDSSPLAAGFLAVIALGIALVGAYLMAVPALELEK